MDLRDRLTRGFVAGIIAGVPPLFLNVALALIFKARLWLYFTSTLIFGHPPTGPMETVLASLSVFFFEGILGIFFAYFITLVSSRNLFFKGWVYGVAVWMGSYAATMLFQIPGLNLITLPTALGNLAGASLFGLGLAFALGWLESRVKAGAEEEHRREAELVYARKLQGTNQPGYPFKLAPQPSLKRTVKPETQAKNDRDQD